MHVETENTAAAKESRVHVVVLGGGFAGLAACRRLNDPRVRVTLVDRQNHHLFQPLLYQVATAGLSATDIAQPLRHIFSDQDNVTTLMDEVKRVDLEARRVELGHGSSLTYDKLVVALGARTGYFGHDEWVRHAPGLKTLAEATHLRREFLLAFERAETAIDPLEADRLLNFVVVGGGPTGVETAGALAELARRVLVDDFRRIDPTRARVHLIEAAPKLLTMFTADQSDYTRRRLEKMGVKVHVDSPVSEVGEGYVIAGGKRFESAVTIWAAGVEGSAVTRTMAGAPLDRSGRIQVAPDLSLPERRDVFAAGDVVLLTDAKDVRVPGVAPAATQMGRHAAEQILADVDGRARVPFVYRDKGSMATIGRSTAVAKVFGMRWTGLPAWLLWMSVHLVFLMGMRNRIGVFLSWIWSYCRWQRGARIIVDTRGPVPEELVKR